MPPGKILNSGVQSLALHEAVSSSVNGVELAAQELCPGRCSLLPFFLAQPRDGTAGAGGTEHCALGVEKGCDDRMAGRWASSHEEPRSRSKQHWRPNSCGHSPSCRGCTTLGPSWTLSHPRSPMPHLTKTRPKVSLVSPFLSLPREVHSTLLPPHPRRPGPWPISRAMAILAAELN